jgi:hypothetical protein
MIAAYFPPIAREARQPIIECGAELGSLVLWGRTTAHTHWEFQTVSTDWLTCMLDDGEPAGLGPSRIESQWVTSWADALALLDERRWELWVPGTVHAHFRADALAAVTRRLVERNDESAMRMMGRWIAACSERKAA